MFRKQCAQLNSHETHFFDFPKHCWCSGNNSYGRWGLTEHIPLMGFQRKTHPQMFFPSQNMRLDSCDGNSSQTHQQAPSNPQLHPGHTAQKIPFCTLRKITPSYKMLYSCTIVLVRNGVPSSTGGTYVYLHSRITLERFSAQFGGKEQAERKPWRKAADQLLKVAPVFTCLLLHIWTSICSPLNPGL